MFAVVGKAVPVSIDAFEIEEPSSSLMPSTSMVLSCLVEQGYLGKSN
jgi:hypothetical protein